MLMSDNLTLHATVLSGTAQATNKMAVAHRQLQIIIVVVRIICW